MYSYFQSVWNVRQRHMVTGLPPQYLYILRCQSGQSSLAITWFPNGPNIAWIPLPESSMG